MNWIFYQSPDDSGMIAQQPTSEQWVLGYGLYVNTLFHWALTLFRREDDANEMRSLMNRLEIRGDRKSPHRHEGFAIPHKPYYSMWAYKSDSLERFDLLGNSLAILTGIASPTRSRQMTGWVEKECEKQGFPLPPCLLPFIQPGDPDWRPRYESYNLPAHYHNGGVWPFICGFYIAALVAAGRHQLARQKLVASAEIVRPAREQNVDFGFNEWCMARGGEPMGQDWQTWSAAMYIYAAECVRSRATPFFSRPTA